MLATVRPANITAMALCGGPAEPGSLRRRRGAEEGAVRQPGRESGRQRQVEVRGCRGQDVACGEPAHQDDQRVLRGRRPAARQQRRADHHAERVGGDQLAGLRNRHCQVSGDLRQQAMTANSPVPMANPPTARASSARRTRLSSLRREFMH